MTKIVTDAGFAPDIWDEGPALDIPADTDPETLRPGLASCHALRINFDGFGDGRGFTLARRLRLMGYAGRLRARGHILADQYAMARRAGFDEVEIPDDLARRQPEDHWQMRADWRAHDYQARLRG